MIDQVIRLQALVRGFLERRKYRIKKSENKKSSNYFTEEEAKETQSNKKFDKDAPLKNKVHTYRSGAIYTGQWKGGLRHGQGTMVWTDNARYEGQWQFNAAFGRGKFFHADGDIYHGEWLNNKAHGHGIYSNEKGARYEGDWV